MALTDIIETELLATLQGDGDPQAILDKFAGSKGALYAGLARATATATARFAEIRQKLRDAQARSHTAENDASAAVKRADQAERRAKAAEKRLADATAAVQAQQALLDRAQALQAVGFDEAAFATLGQSLANVANTEGTTPAQAVARFLGAAADFEGIATIRRRAADAEERANRAEADARHREEQAKVRGLAVAWAEWFVKRRITVEAVGAWQAAAEALGLTVDTLAQGLAGALQRFGSLESACEARAKERDTLTVEAEKLKAAVATLRQEREKIRAALDAVAADGSNRVAGTETQAVAAIRMTGDQYQVSIREAGEMMAETIRHFAEVQREAAELEQYVRWARALASGDPSEWREVEPVTWAAFLWHLGRWVEAAGVNPGVPIPDEVLQVSRGSSQFPTVHGPFEVPLLALAAWLAEGLRAVPAAATLALAAGGAARRRVWSFRRAF